MRNIGLYLVIFGGGSFLLNLMGREFVILSWIDNWGPTVGNVLRGGAVLVGAGLFVGGAMGDRPEEG